jgi:hypothetical protein
MRQWWTWSRIIRPQESLALYKTFNTLCLQPSVPQVKYGVRSPMFIWAPHVYSCAQWLRPRNSPLPPIWAHIGHPR